MFLALFILTAKWGARANSITSGDDQECFLMTTASTDHVCECSSKQINELPGYEVNCPDKVRLQFQTDRSYFNIDCRQSNQDLEVSHMPIIELGLVVDIHIHGCKIPASTPLVDVLSRFGIPSTDDLFLSNYDEDFAFRREFFKGLILLKRLTLNEIKVELPEDSFAEIADITWLMVTNTKLKRVKNSLAILTRLEVLRMATNAITQLEEGAFETMPSLLELSLRSNGLTSLGKHDFRGLNSLYHLDMSDNHIQIIHADTFLPLVKLTDLDLRKNAIHPLDSALFKL